MVVVTIIKINVDVVDTTRAPTANPVGVGEGATGATRDLVTVEVVNKVEVGAEVTTHLIIILGVISSILYGINY